MEKNASILVVDDDKEIADLVEIYLVNDGYQVLKCFGWGAVFTDIEGTSGSPYAYSRYYDAGN